MGFSYRSLEKECMPGPKSTEKHTNIKRNHNKSFKKNFRMVFPSIRGPLEIKTSPRIAFTVYKKIYILPVVP